MTRSDPMREVVVYTPNYAIHPFKVVYDSTVAGKFQDAQAAYKYYKNRKAEDEDVKIFHVDDGYSNVELLMMLNKTMEIATPGSMYYTDRGIIAQRFMERVKDDELWNEYEKKIKELEDTHDYKPKPWAKIKRK